LRACCDTARRADNSEAEERARSMWVALARALRTREKICASSNVRVFDAPQR